MWTPVSEDANRHTSRLRGLSPQWPDAHIATSDMCSRMCSRQGRWRLAAPEVAYGVPVKCRLDVSICGTAVCR